MKSLANAAQCMMVCSALILMLSTNVCAVSANQLAVVFNASDPESREIAGYYQQQRQIPQANMIAIRMPGHKAQINRQEFAQVYAQVVAATPAKVQFYALAWSKPYRVACMSVTSAFAFGFDEKYCAKGCVATAPSAYFNSSSEQPYTDFKIRPAILLAGSSLDQVRAMIDRGVRADHSRPEGTAYLLSTSDKARNVRAGIYPDVVVRLGDRLPIQIVEANVLRNKSDVMFYFTGLKSVAEIESNTFLDGAIADHLTSSGGNLFGGAQMSALHWLDASATASYGTVVEPCAFPQKFPNPGIVIDRYTRGEALIEAYWKSVQWPGQGVFVGEPLAAPYAGQKDL
jgi:uncharacterized protein (TIGR03790 family)